MAGSRMRTLIPALINALNSDTPEPDTWPHRLVAGPSHGSGETRVRSPLGPPIDARPAVNAGANRRTKSAPSRHQVQTALLISDSHYLEHDPAALACVYGAIPVLRPSVFVGNGDLLECLAANAHDNKRRGGTRRSDDLKDAIRAEAGQCLREFVRPLTEALGPDCRKVYLFGNHEDRVRRAMEKSASEDEIKLAELLKLRALGWEYDDEPNAHFDLWGIDVQHGDEPCAGGSGMYAARWRAVGYGRDVIFGHTHTAARFSHPREGGPVRGINNPCLCGIERARSWSGNSRRAWSHGFTVIRRVEGSRPFIDMVEIIDGRCVVDGVLVDGNRLAKEAAA